MDKVSRATNKIASKTIKSHHKLKMASGHASKHCSKLPKYLPIPKQRFLPVRQFDTIASIDNVFIHAAHSNYSHMSGSFARQGKVIGLLPPPSSKRFGFGLGFTTLHNINSLLRGNWWLRGFANVRRFGMAVNNTFKSRPLVWGAVFAAVKSVAADYFAQTVIEGKSFDEVNWKRNLVFFALGLFWTGYVHYFLYSFLYPRLFRGIANKHWFIRGTIQSAFDQTFHSALLYYPFFYCIKGCIYDGFNTESCKKSLDTYWNVNFWNDLKNLWTVWYPANLITFGFMPVHLRVPWIACVSFAWIVILSLVRGEKEKEKQQESIPNTDTDTNATQQLEKATEAETDLITIGHTGTEILDSQLVSNIHIAQMIEIEDKIDEIESPKRQLMSIEDVDYNVAHSNTMVH